jgi:23S rRNA (pseudouridine1915-N3)-methyltransferase
MLNITFITVGTLKEDYLRSAVGEYIKRMSAYCRPNVIELKEVKVPDSPSKSEIDSALSAEGERILASVPPRAYKVALCVEGKQLSSEELAAAIDGASMEHSDICFIIGSSHGLSDKVKRAADYKLSLSKMTFPHQLFRVMLLESVYRAFNIIKGTKYHK